MGTSRSKMLIFLKGLDRNVRYQSANICEVYINGMISEFETAKQESTVGQAAVLGMMFVCGWFRGDIRYTERIAETSREGAINSILPLCHE